MFEAQFTLPYGLNFAASSNGSAGVGEKEMMSLKGHLPGIASNPSPTGRTDFRFRHIESDILDLHQSPHDLVLYDEWKGRISPDFPHLLYGMARTHWLAMGIFPVHAACVGLDETSYILLVGPAGSGKTSTALHAASAYGLKIFSGDKTLVKVHDEEELQGIAGTTTMTVRSGDKGRWISTAGRVMDFGNRQMFDLKPEFMSQRERVHIGAIAMIQLNDGRTMTEMPSPLSAAHRLYPYFMDLERADVLVGSGEKLMDGSIHPSVKTCYAPPLVKVIKDTPVINMVGSLDFVANGIATLAKRLSPSGEQAA